MTRDERRERLEHIADELDLAVGDGVVEESLDIADELSGLVERLDEPADGERESVGAMVDDEYNALLEVYPEPRDGGSGPLDGLDVAVKDVIAAEDLTMTCGSQSFAHVPSFDATVVERLVEAGASVVGKANTDAFAFGPTGEFSEYGHVTNPAAPDRVPGGSSSGSGAAVAGGLVDAALGTDTGGSVRIPSSCCGVVGIRPTHGVVPRYGLEDLSLSMDTIGPLGKDAQTVAAVLDAIAGHDHRDPSSSHATLDGLSDLDADGELTVALLDELFDASDDAVADAVRETIRRVGADGDVTVETASVDLGEIESSFPLAAMGEFRWLARQANVARGQGTNYDAAFTAALDDATYNDHIATRLLPAALLDAETDGRSYLLARREGIRFAEQLDALLDDADVLASPTMRSLPPKLDRTGATNEGLMKVAGNTLPVSLTGFPAASVPGVPVDGVPVGVQFVGRPLADADVLGAARRVEAAVGT